MKKSLENVNLYKRRNSMSREDITKVTIQIVNGRSVIYMYTNKRRVSSFTSTTESIIKFVMALFNTGDYSITLRNNKCD